MNEQFRKIVFRMWLNFGDEDVVFILEGCSFGVGSGDGCYEYRSSMVGS
jgi:hypothetical protein